MTVMEMKEEEIDNKVSAVLTYPCKPDSSFQSGRYIDDEHWKKVAGIFPLESYPSLKSDVEKHLDDTSKPYNVEVLNGRTQDPSLETEGFTLVCDVPTQMKDFGDGDEVEDLCLTEVKSLIERAFANTSTPIRAVVPFHWLVRDSRRSNYDSSKGPATFNGMSHAPVARVHGDYTVENGPLRFDELQEKGLLPADWDKDKAHWGIVNVWRNVAEDPIAIKPLAVLDCTSVPLESIFQYWLVKRDKARIGRNLAVGYDAAHRWMFFPQMTNSESLLFFTFECNSKATRRWVFHTAFDAPLEVTPEGEEKSSMPYRVSIETRCLVVFDPKEDE